MRNPQTEAWLDRYGVEYEREIIQVKQIDVDKSLSNQARMGQPVIPGLLNRYTIAMESGDEFPAIVVYWSKSADGFVIIDGNHRYQAARSVGKSEMDAYRVKIDDAYLIELLTRSANGLMGEPPSEAMRYEHAKTMVKRHGMTIASAARAFYVGESKLGTAIRVEKVDAWLVDMSLDPASVKETNRETLGQIRNFNVRKRFFELMRDTEMNTELAKELSQELRSLPDESAMLAHLEDYAERSEVVTTLKSESPRAQQSKRVWQAIGMVNSLAGSSVVEFGITQADVLQDFIDKAQRAAVVLVDLIEDAQRSMP